MAQAKRSARSAPASPRHTGAKSAHKATSSGLAPGSEQSTETVADLQRTAGNRAVTKLLTSGDRTLQRVPVAAEFHETLYNKESGAGMATAPPRGFTGGSPTTVANPDKASYEMTWNADNSGVTVLIKIRFLQQARNTTPPSNPNSTGLPELGQLLGRPTVIPVNDPPDRRTWAKDTANKATTLWNTRKISFASVDHPQPGEGAGSYAPPLPPTPIRLAVTFKAEAVFGVNDPAHQEVIVHPQASIPGSPGHPIDAGNWYQQDPAKRAAAYPQSDNVIYAHEYGHMLGTKNFSNLDIASKAVRGSFAVGPVSQLVGDAYWAALLTPHETNVTVAGFDDVRVNIATGCMERLAQRRRSPARQPPKQRTLSDLLPRARGFQPPRLPA